jgi:hypothetical protein
MTLEKKCVVKPEDILAIRIQCVECGAASIVPIAKASTLAGFLVRSCMSCGKASGLSVGAEEFDKLAAFGETLGRISEILKAKGITYCFQIECPKE